MILYVLTSQVAVVSSRRRGSLEVKKCVILWNLVKTYFPSFTLSMKGWPPVFSRHQQQQASLQDTVGLAAIARACLSVCTVLCVEPGKCFDTRWWERCCQSRPQPRSRGAGASWTELWLTLAFSSWQGWQCQAKIGNVALLASPHPSLPSLAASLPASSLCRSGCLYTALSSFLFPTLAWKSHSHLHTQDWQFY